MAASVRVEAVVFMIAMLWLVFFMVVLSRNDASGDENLKKVVVMRSWCVCNTCVTDALTPF